MVKNIAKYALILVLLIAGFQADLVSKKWAQNQYKGKSPVSAVNGFMEFGYTENRGMVFGVMNHKEGNNAFKLFLLVMRIVLIVGVAVFVFLRRKKNLWYLLPFLLIIAGGGNIFDQMTSGFVIDFIHIHLGNFLDWPFFFNIADVYLTLGMVLLMIKYSIPAQKKVPQET